MAEEHLRLGDLNLLYEDGFVRYISFGDREVLRKIYFALRDRNWTTIGFVVSEHVIHRNDDHFDLSYTATHRVEDNDVFRWQVKIVGTNTNQLKFEIDGVALAPFTRNRAGLCVLHTTGAKPVTVTRPDGTQYESAFPEQVSPHQPFLDIRTFRWRDLEEAWASIHYEGDIFETEDQRNWSDASFKTYSTPLTVPYPVTLHPGDRVRQSVTFSMDKVAQVPAGDNHTVRVSAGTDRFPFPSLGADFGGTPVNSDEDGQLIEKLRFEHLRIEIDLSSDGWREKLAAGVSEAHRISTRLFLHLVFDASHEQRWSKFVAGLDHTIIGDVKMVALSPHDRKANVDLLLADIYPKVRRLFPKAAIGGGFTSYFTELNRNRFDYSALDFVVYSANPQVHANDTNTIIENLPAQLDVVKSARKISADKTIHVGPVSLRPRYNPDALPGVVSMEAGLPYKFDPRQPSAMAGGWLLATLKYLAEGGAASVTLLETHGMAGYAIAGSDPVHPEYAASSRIFPVYEALLALRNLSPVSVVGSSSSKPRFVTSLLVESAAQRTLILINHRDSRVSVEFGKTVELQPYEYKFIQL